MSSSRCLVVGAGPAGLETALGLLDAGHAVTLLDRAAAPGGLGLHAFGGMALCGTPLQRRSGIPDSPAVALADWLSFAGFGPEDDWPRRWAEHYVERCVPEVWEALHARGLRFIPAVQWVERVAREGWPWTWQLLNRRIADKELAASGAEHNPQIRERRVLGFVRQLLRGQPELVDELLARCPDLVQGATLDELAQRMNALTGDERIDAATLQAQIAPYDAQIARGPALHDDDQLRRIEHLRRWRGDRVRTCRYQRILDPKAGPLIAIRCRLLTRKSMGGLQTDLASRVLDKNGTPIAGLYAVGEAAGFGGGNASGRKSLEGTFLPGCLLTANAAVRHLGA